VPDFPYINARVRAMRSRLLASAQLEELLASPTPASLLQALTSTPYGGDLQEALVRYEGVRAVDEALARNFQRTTRTILQFADGQPRTLIEVLLLRWDLANLRAIVRGKHAGRSGDDVVEVLLPAGTLSEVVLKEMAAQPDMRALAGTLDAVGHPFALPLAHGVAEYMASKDLAALELHLDRAYIEEGLGHAGSKGSDADVLAEIIRFEIDAANVKTALKLARAGDLDAARRIRYFIAGGASVDEGLFLALSSAHTQTQAWDTLRIRHFPVRELPSDPVTFERQLDLSTARTLAGYYRGNPLGLDIVIGYLAMKAAEVANLRLIARGKFLGLPRELVRREMLLV
jgi:V/A-type H+-transporting ATPase subunit C